MHATPVKAGRERLAFHLFWASGMLLALCYGVIAGILHLFPYPVVASAIQGYEQISGNESTDHSTWYYKRVLRPDLPAIANTGRAEPGCNLVTQIQGDALAVKIMGLDGTTLHQWDIDWFKIWPDAQHVPERLLPRTRPGTHVDGATLLDDGDLVFNFEHLGLVRLHPNGTVVWRLPYQTHHSICRDSAGNLWVCGQKEHLQPMPGFPALVPPFVEDTILLVAPDGEIAREWSIPNLLKANGRQGLLCLASQDNFSPAVSGDITHLNHVEPFPDGIKQGHFRAGDVLVSLRNINTVFVFDRTTAAITFLSTGLFVRQHDPHFVDGNTISVFDNYNVPDAGDHAQSRIVLMSAPDQTTKTYFAGSPSNPFFTPILGRHQWLANGDLLITDSCAGRAFELDRNLQVVWWYVNYVDDGVVGAVEQVERLPPEAASRYRLR